MTYERGLKRYHNKKVIKLKKELEEEYKKLNNKIDTIFNKYEYIFKM